MLELPGLTSSGDLGKDLDTLKRYIARLVPALEMELINAGQDDYQEQLSAQTQGVGSAKKQSTAGALVAHELRYDNPHRVTAAQLGLTLDKIMTVTFTTSGLAVRIGEKRGIQINVQDVEPVVNQWEHVEATDWADAALGSWEAEIPVLYAVIPALRAGNSKEFWLGVLSGSTGENIGTLRIHRGCGVDPEENPGTYIARHTEEHMIPMTVIGLGVFGYGEE